MFETTEWSTWGEEQDRTPFGHLQERRYYVEPAPLGELVRESMDDVGWNVTETAARLDCERGTLSRFLNGRAGLSANMALALEDIGWGTADHWMRMQAAYELAQARQRRAGKGQTEDRVRM